MCQITAVLRLVVQHRVARLAIEMVKFPQIWPFLTALAMKKRI